MNLKETLSSTATPMPAHTLFNEAWIGEAAP